MSCPLVHDHSGSLLAPLVSTEPCFQDAVPSHCPWCLAPWDQREYPHDFSSQSGAQKAEHNLDPTP